MILSDARRSTKAQIHRDKLGGVCGPLTFSNSGSKRDVVLTLQRQHLTHFGWGRNIERQFAQDAANLLDLGRVGLSEFTFREIEIVFEANSDVSTHDRTRRDEVRLMASCCENGPVVVITEELVRNAPHVDEVFDIAADAAKDAEDRLHEQWRLNQSAFEKMSQRVKVADVVALKFKLRSATFAESLQDRFDVSKCVLKNPIASVFEILWLPRMLPIAELTECRIKPEVHRTHVERSHLRLSLRRPDEPLFDGHVMSATGCDVDDRISACLDLWEEIPKHSGIRCRTSGLRITGM